MKKLHASLETYQLFKHRPYEFSYLDFWQNKFLKFEIAHRFPRASKNWSHLGTDLGVVIVPACIHCLAINNELQFKNCENLCKQLDFLRRHNIANHGRFAKNLSIDNFCCLAKICKVKLKL